MQSKICFAWMAIFILSLFIISCSGGTGSGGGDTPAPIDDPDPNGNGGNDPNHDPRNLTTMIENQTTMLNERIQELEANKATNEMTIADLRRQITELETQISALPQFPLQEGKIQDLPGNDGD